MDKIPTAEEYLDNVSMGLWEDQLTKEKMADCVPVSALINFAKFHVEAALKQASESAEVDGFCESGDNHCILIKSSILDCYPLENIK